MPHHPDRRDFLKTAAIAGVGLGLGGYQTAGAERGPAIAPPRAPYPGTGLLTAPPLERVRMGFVGVGHQGSSHVENFLKIDNVDIVAICDVTPANLARWIHDAPAVKEGVRMPAEPLDAADLRAVVAYLETLRRAPRRSSRSSARRSSCCARRGRRRAAGAGFSPPSTTRPSGCATS